MISIKLLALFSVVCLLELARAQNCGVPTSRQTFRPTTTPKESSVAKTRSPTHGHGPFQSASPITFTSMAINALAP